MEFEEDEEEYKSRSQLKRDHEEIKELVAQLIEMSPQQLKHIPLHDSNRVAIREAKKMARSEINRQIRFIAGRLDSDDVEEIRAALVEGPKARARANAEAKAVPDEAQLWSEELIAGDNQILSEFIDQHPDTDVQHLRQLVRNAKKERKSGKSTKAQAALIETLSDN